MLSDSSVFRYEIPRGEGVAVSANGEEIRVERSASHVALGWPSSLPLNKLAHEARRVSGRPVKPPLLGDFGRIRELHHPCLLRVVRLLRPRPTFLRLDGQRLTMVIQQSESGYQLACLWPGRLRRQEASQILNETADPTTQAQSLASRQTAQRNLSAPTKRASHSMRRPLLIAAGSR